MKTLRNPIFWKGVASVLIVQMVTGLAFFIVS